MNVAYSFTKADEERMQRKRIRAEEIGLRLFVLDEDEMPKDLRELENYIIDNYIDLDIEIPNEIKEKYIRLKEMYGQQ